MLYGFNGKEAEEAKFKILEAEIMRNQYERLDQQRWYELLRLCRFLTTSRTAKKMGLTVDEMVAIKLFLDFPNLRRYFRRCFHDRDPQRRSAFQSHILSLESGDGLC